ANLVLLGEEAEIKAAAEKEGLDISAAQIVSPKDPERIDRYAQILYEARKHKGVDLEKAKAMLADVSYFGTLMIAAGEADG
ncbi:phosphate acyltransferase, partial [Streptococcus agalactiae]